MATARVRTLAGRPPYKKRRNPHAGSCIDLHGACFDNVAIDFACESPAMATRTQKRAVIVGAGIVGAASAYFLARAGFEVRVADACAPASAASGAADGAVSVASKRPGPLMEAAIRGVETYRDLTAQGVLAGHFRERSTFMVAQDGDEDAVLERHARSLEQSSVEVRHHDRHRLRTLMPVLSPQVASAVEVRREGHAIGYEIVNRLLEASGASVLRGCRVRAIAPDAAGRRVASLDTSAGVLKAELFVLAAGNGSAALLGLGGALRPRKGQLFVTERAPALNAGLPGSLMSCRYLMSKDSTDRRMEGSGRRFGLVVDPLRTGQFLIGGTREDTGDHGTDFAALRLLLGEAVALVPALAGVRLLRTFSGIRTATTDGRPLIGRAPGLDNLIVATGFEGDGICLGPLTGRLVSELAQDKPPAIALAPFDPGRFTPDEKAA